MNITPHIVIAGGGGNVHLLPALAIADALERAIPDVAITFVGPGEPVERHAVRMAGYSYIAIPTQPPPQGPFEAVRFVAENFVGYWASRWVLREQMISMVLSLGGHASAMVSRAAIVRGIPTVLVEQNAVPSRVTRWLAKSATTVCTAFDEVKPLLPSTARIVLTGNPVRIGVGALAGKTPAASANGSDQPKRLLVLGGRGGAAAINQFAPAALKRIQHRLQGWHVVHQTGSGQLQSVEDRYIDAGIDALSISSIEEMGHVLAETDLVVCRAGGPTLAELAVAGVPAIVLPNPDAPDDHQMANAQVFAATDACRLIDERTCEGRVDEVLASQLDALMADDKARHAMATAIRTLARPCAAREIANICAQLLAKPEVAAAAA